MAWYSDIAHTRLLHHPLRQHDPCARKDKPCEDKNHLSVIGHGHPAFSSNQSTETIHWNVVTRTSRQYTVFLEL